MNTSRKAAELDRSTKARSSEDQSTDDQGAEDGADLIHVEPTTWHAGGTLRRTPSFLRLQVRARGRDRRPRETFATNRHLPAGRKQLASSSGAPLHVAETPHVDDERFGPHLETPRDPASAPPAAPMDEADLEADLEAALTEAALDLRERAGERWVALGHGESARLDQIEDGLALRLPLSTLGTEPGVATLDFLARLSERPLLRVELSPPDTQPSFELAATLRAPLSPEALALGVEALRASLASLSALELLSLPAARAWYAQQVLHDSERPSQGKKDLP